MEQQQMTSISILGLIAKLSLSGRILATSYKISENKGIL